MQTSAAEAVGESAIERIRIKNHNCNKTEPSSYDGRLQAPVTSNLLLKIHAMCTGNPSLGD